MQYRELGRTKEKLSVIGLGTMTWGEQNTREEAFTQMDFARDAGVNFFDVAEMYPVPPRPETYGDTESIIGQWFAQQPTRRDEVFLATKVTGPSDVMSAYMGRGALHFDRHNIETALNQSLKRLQTDRIDLYQLHWPDRSANYFGQLGFQPGADNDGTPMLETLQVLQDFVQQGKIRHIGLSNETPWGTMQALHLAQTHNLPRVVSVQNPYSVLNRTYEVGLAEIGHREEVGLLAYSPLGFGVLTGKYRHGAKPEKARLTLYERFSRYLNPQAQLATEMYLTLADDFGVSPVDIALGFVNTRSFVTSNIIGATDLSQLKENINSIDFKLTPEMLERIDAVHQSFSNPAP